MLHRNSMNGEELLVVQPVGVYCIDDGRLILMSAGHRDKLTIRAIK